MSRLTAILDLALDKGVSFTLQATLPLGKKSLVPTGRESVSDIVSVRRIWAKRNLYRVDPEDLGERKFM